MAASSQIVGQWGSIDYKTLQVFVNAIDYPLELVSKTLLLKTPHASVTDHGETKQVLIRKLHHYLLDFPVLEGIMHTARGERDHQSYPAVHPVSSTNN